MRKLHADIALTMVLTISLPGLCLRPPAPQTGIGGQKVIRDPAEYKAYTNARNIRDANQRGAALEAFLRAYPDTVVKIEVMEQAVAAYQQAGNTGKMEEVARRILVLEPNSLRALAIITYLERSASTNNVSSVCLHAHRGLQALASWPRPEAMSEAEFHRLHTQIAEIFFGADGFCALREKNYAAARDSYLKALQINPGNLQNVRELGTADLDMQPLDVRGFWYIAKAIHLAQGQGKANDKQAMEAYGKAKYRSYHGGDDGWDQLVAEAATQTAPPVNGLEIKKKLTPAELAVQAVQQNPPDSLALSDWEYILQFRDASPANREAANTIWAAIQAKEKNGDAKLKFTQVKVISCTTASMDAAITDDNKAANTADVHVILEKLLSHPLEPGSTTDISGVLTAYTAQPFIFTMEKGELPEIIHSELSEADIKKLLHGGVTPKRATELVKQKGVDFALDPQTRRRLIDAGATPELLGAIETGRKQ